VKLLLTSGGITNPAINDALVGLLGKPIAECGALFIPTAQYGQPACTPVSVWRSIAGQDTVWVGMSAGSMVMTPRIGEEFVDWKSPTGGDETLGVVDFSIFPHLDYPDWPSNTLASAREWARKIPGPAYAIDDETAISVVDGSVEVVSQGHWELFNAGPTA
jgi:hypothetical protein